jgi:heat shock protein HtpX
LYEQIAANKRKTFLLIFGFVLLLTLVGLAFNYLLQWRRRRHRDRGGDRDRLVDRVVLQQRQGRARDLHAKPADPHQYARLYNLIEGLCIASGLPKPRLYIIEDEAPNAFATGRNPKHAAIAVTTGLLEKMNRVELEGGAAPRAEPHPQLRHPRDDAHCDNGGIIALLSDFFLAVHVLRRRS